MRHRSFFDVSLFLWTSSISVTLVALNEVVADFVKHGLVSVSTQQQKLIDQG